jgi:hypothetical protein
MLLSSLVLLSFISAAVVSEQIPFLSSSPSTSSIRNCGSHPSDLFTPSNVSISPDPPILGQKAVLILTGTLSADVVEGYGYFNGRLIHLI